jgi:hypothetical protein
MTTDNLFQEGGEFNIREAGSEEYEMQIQLAECTLIEIYRRLFARD